MDPGSAPQWIGHAYVSYQLANFQRGVWPAGATSRLPSPEQTKTSAMPTDDGLGLDDLQGVHNTGRKPIEGAKTKRSKVLKVPRFSSEISLNPRRRL
jgi:hypothetical protein